MHEMALVRKVVDIVLEKAEAVGASEVCAVHLAIGESRDIVEEYFEGLFKYLARGTIAENAELVIYRIPYTVRCNQCGCVFPLNVFDKTTWKCPACKAERDYKLNTGMEFVIKNIEIASSAPPQPVSSDAPGVIAQMGQ
ncbi:MAG: hydrogenase maturation nickel metallochaperone HypA [Lachnospiraceae bacterium]|nr:hydrogenase maturation nickel metallochaperone HypA [Lachnospiraceae bacterium]